jgi:hypothetical protein
MPIVFRQRVQRQGVDGVVRLQVANLRRHEGRRLDSRAGAHFVNLPFGRKVIGLML